SNSAAETADRRQGRAGPEVASMRPQQFSCGNARCSVHDAPAVLRASMRPQQFSCGNEIIGSIISSFISRFNEAAAIQLRKPRAAPSFGCGGGGFNEAAAIQLRKLAGYEVVWLTISRFNEAAAIQLRKPREVVVSAA